MKSFHNVGVYCFLDQATCHSLWLQAVGKFHTWSECCKARLYSFKSISNLWRRGTSDAKEWSRYTCGQMDRKKQPIFSAGGLAWRRMGMFTYWSPLFFLLSFLMSSVAVHQICIGWYVGGFGQLAKMLSLSCRRLLLGIGIQADFNKYFWVS